MNIVGLNSRYLLIGAHRMGELRGSPPPKNFETISRRFEFYLANNNNMGEMHDKVSQK